MIIALDRNKLIHGNVCKNDTGEDRSGGNTNEAIDT